MPLQQLASRGTATPCVARTMLQTGELAGPFALSAEFRNEVNRVAYDLMLRLIAALDHAEPVIAQVAEGKRWLGQRQLHLGGHLTSLPSVVDLRGKAEGFLFTCKQALRDVGGLFKVFFGQPFEHRFNKALQWAADTYGAHDPLTRVLQDNASWVERIIEMRNAIEHPTGTSGVVTIHNFRRLGNGSPPEVLEPSWQRGPEPLVPIAQDMQNVMDRILVMYEELLCICLRKADPLTPIDFWEVPPSDRDPAKPFRLRAVPRGLLPLHGE